MKCPRYPALIALLVLGILVTTLAADAQQPGKVARIGYLAQGSAPSGPIFEAFRQGLRELGYVEGENLAVEWGSPSGSLISRARSPWRCRSSH